MLESTKTINYKFMIICYVNCHYYPGGVKVIVADKRKPASGGVGYAKAAGNYAASILPNQFS